MLNLDQLASGKLRYDYTRSEIEAIYDLPITRLIFLAQSVHQKYFEPDEIQMSTLLSLPMLQGMQMFLKWRKASRMM